MSRQGFERAANRPFNSFAVMTPKEPAKRAPSKALLQDRVSAATAAFWAKGGEIKKLPPGKMP